MTRKHTLSLVLSLPILLASTSLSHAGFIWEAPASPSVSAVPYEQQAEPSLAEGATVQGRAWQTVPSVPSVEGKAVAATTFGQGGQETASNEAFPRVPSASASGPEGGVPAADMTPVLLGSLSDTPTEHSENVLMASAEGSGVVPVAPVAPDSVVDPVPATVDSANQPVPALNAGAQAVLRSETVIGTPRFSKGDRPLDHAPAAVVPVPSVPASPAAPVAAPSPYQGSPVLVAPATAAATPVELAPVAPAYTPSEAPQAQVVSPITGQPVAAPAPSAPSPSSSPSDAPIVEGFGKQVPLVVALRQILPANYSFAHRDGVDLSASVDWNGGRPWPDVLLSTLAPLGLKATISADTVMIEPATR